MVSYDKNEAVRLVSKLREDDARMTAAPWRAGAVETCHVFCADGAELGPERVLLKMNTYFPYDADANAIASLRNNARPLADQLEAAGKEIERLTRERDEALGDGVLSQRVCDIENENAQLRIERDMKLDLEVELMRPVVTKALAWSGDPGSHRELALSDAIDTYRAAKEKP